MGYMVDVVDAGEWLQAALIAEGVPAEQAGGVVSAAVAMLWAKDCRPPAGAVLAAACAADVVERLGVDYADLRAALDAGMPAAPIAEWSTAQLLAGWISSFGASDCAEATATLTTLVIRRLLGDRADEWLPLVARGFYAATAAVRSAGGASGAVH